MDHITQLYQNRAKVLQEEVTRLEALLEAMVVAPPISVSSGWSKEKAARDQRIKDQKAAADTAAALAKAEKDKEAKAIAEHPIGAPIVGALKSTGEAIGNIGNYLDNPYLKYGLGGLVTWGLATPRWSVNPEKAGKLTSIFSDQQVDQRTGEAIQGIFKKKPEPLGRGFIARMVNNARNASRLKDVVKQKTDAEALEAATKQSAEEAAAKVKEAERLLRVERQKQTILRMAAATKEGEIDPIHGLLRRGDIPRGRVTSFQPGGRAKIAAYFESIGEPMEPEAIEMLSPKPYEPHVNLRLSMGVPTPEDIKLLGQTAKDLATSQGAKDLAMTGKEVADRSVLARGARALGTPAKVARILPVAGAVLSTPDAIRRAKEGDSVGSIGAIAQNFDPTGTIPWAMHMKDTLEQRAKEASTLQRSAQGGTDAVEDWFARPFMDSSMTGRGSNVRQVVQPGEVSPARANYSDVVVAGSVEAPTKGAPTAIQITPEQAREMANPSGAETPTAARDELQAQKEADRQRRLRELRAQRITPSMKM